MTTHELSQRRACGLIGITRRGLKREPVADRNRGLRQRLRELVVQAGAPPTQFLDDQDYPFKVNPHFKAWVPIVDNPRCLLVYRPGAKPQVLFHQPNDYWHKPAALPRDPWTDAVDLTAMADPANADAAWVESQFQTAWKNADTTLDLAAF